MTTILIICGVLAALGAALAAIPKIYRAFVACAAFVVNFNRAAPILLHLANEIRPNGGSSLKDQVTRIDKTLGSLNITFTEHTASDAEQFAKLMDGIKGQNIVLAKQDTVLASIQKNVSGPKELRIKT